MPLMPLPHPAFPDWCGEYGRSGSSGWDASRNIPTGRPGQARTGSDRQPVPERVRLAFQGHTNSGDPDPPFVSEQDPVQSLVFSTSYAKDLWSPAEAGKNERME